MKTGTLEPRLIGRGHPVAAMAAISAGAALMLAGCTGTDAPPASSGPQDEVLNITFVAGVKGDPFYITMSCGAQAAAEEAGATFNFQAPESFSPTDQIPIVDAVAAAKPDALLIAPTDPASMYTPIKRVVDAGTRLVLVDTSLDNTDIASASIKTDDYEGGVEAAKVLAELIGGPGDVLLLNFIAGVTTTEARGQGFVDAAADLGLNVIAKEYSGEDIEKGAQIVDATLQRYPDLAGIFTTTDYGAQGTVASLRNAQKLGDVKVVGFDASPVMVEQLRSGDIQAIVSQQARKIGELGVQQALHAIRGEATDGVIKVPTLTITSENIDSADVAAGLQVDSCN